MVNISSVSFKKLNFISRILIVLIMLLGILVAVEWLIYRQILTPTELIYINEAVLNRNALVCDIIKNKSKNVLCLNLVYDAMYSLSECDKKGERIMPADQKVDSYLLGFKDDCYVAAAERKQDDAICDKIKTIYFRDECYLRVGEARFDYKICDKSGQFRDQCYWKVNDSKPDLFICEKIGTQDYKEGCYKSVAIAKKDESVCGKIKSNDDYWLHRDYCYAEVAILKNNASICDNLTIQAKNYCYSIIGATIRDASICDKIEDTKDTTWKSKCYQSIGRSN